MPLSDNSYFPAEVRPHVEEAWINLDSTKNGYEISFNKYFYRHKPLRSMEEVARDIIAMERQAEGLIADILGIDVNRFSRGLSHYCFLIRWKISAAIFYVNRYTACIYYARINNLISSKRLPCPTNKQ
ncbi:hypothetical protein [Methylobacter sp.]|uniref:hypothetical protein n=1 Tax=Methylobacter sp. TaxID=2051955 RepID=UPI0025DF2AFC|nr:hypothetical protein [Methylobacter sp.]